MKAHKYGAQPTWVDCVRFASKAEARRYQELKLLEKAGEIEGLELQPRFALMVPSTTGNALKAATDGLVRIGEYRGDFMYLDYRRGRIVEDVKGYATPLYRWKKRHVEHQYGITIQEIRL